MYIAIFFSLVDQYLSYSFKVQYFVFFRFFRRRDQLPPIPNDVYYSNADSPSILSKRTSEGVRSKRSLSYVCPRNEQWEDIMLAINADDQLVQMVQVGSVGQ